MRDMNYLVRATALEDRVRAIALNATDVVGDLQQRHGTYPAASAALGRTAMGALLLGAATLKEPDHVLTVEVRGNGPIGEDHLHRKRGGRGARAREQRRGGRGNDGTKPAFAG